LQSAQEEGACDSILQTVFKVSIAAAKKIKTNIRLSSITTSVAYRAIEILKKEMSLFDKKAIVIGNGEVGKLLAKLLVAEGVKTTVTVREYKKGVVEVPKGCGSIAYSLRYDYLSECDLCLSATTSPHYTIVKSQIEHQMYPKYFIDLAVPRDIESKIAELGVKIINVDDLGSGQIDESDIAMIEEIQNKHKERFYKWYDYKMSLERAI